MLEVFLVKMVRNSKKVLMKVISKLAKEKAME